MTTRSRRPLLDVVPRIVLGTTFVAVIPVCAAIVPSLACVPNYCPPDAGCDDGTDSGADAGDAGDAAVPVTCGSTPDATPGSIDAGRD